MARKPRFPDSEEFKLFWQSYPRRIGKGVARIAFIKACEKIYELSQDCKSCDLLKHNKIERLVAQLKGNDKIDFRKLDLYHNITAIELLEYGKNVIRQDPYIDKTIIESMNGSIISSKRYLERKQMVEELYEHTYNVKFKDVPKRLKDERFTGFK